MSGVEVAGFVLAVLPLFISAAEHYRDVTSPFCRYMRYDSKVRLFQSKLETQSSIYHEEVKWLLEQALDSALADSMAEDTTHSAWKGNEAEARLKAYLGGNYQTCSYVVQAMEDALEKIGEVTRKFSEAIKYDEEGNIREEPLSKKKILRKLDFSLSKSHLSDQLETLRTLNHDFQTLTRQADRRRLHKKCQIDSTSSPVKLSRHEMRDFRLVQRAAKTLYEQLGDSCTIHIDHNAHFSLDPHINTSIDTSISFDIAFRQTITDRGNTAENIIWFSVESTIRDDHGDAVVAAINSTVTGPLVEASSHSVGGKKTLASLCRFNSKSKFNYVLDSEAEQPAKSRKKVKPTVSFKDEEPGITWLPSSEDKTVPDFLKDQNFCTHISRRSKQHAGPLRSCIGCLERDPSCRLLVYMTGSPLPRKQPQMASLARKLEALKAKKEAGHISNLDRIRFARLLATAALQFYNTPWLKNGLWRSQDVFVLDDTAYDGDEHRPPTLKTPYMDIAVKGAHRPISRPTTEINRPYIRNPYLFGLCLLLIELAYQQPLAQLQRPSDLQPGGDPEYAVADRLVEMVGSALGGRRYQKVVEKCLNNFGSRQDFSDERLQEQYHKEVVCELEQLEKHFEWLDIDE